MESYEVTVILTVEDDDGAEGAMATAQTILTDAGGSDVENKGSFGFALIEAVDAKSAAAPCYIVYLSDYADPCPMVGPFPNYDAALAAYRERKIAEGGVEDEGMTAQALYVEDDEVRIARLFDGVVA